MEPRIKKKTNNVTLSIIIGPMMSGKTTELFRRLQIYAINGWRVAYIKHENDIRGVEFSTHNMMYNQPHPNITFLTFKTLQNIVLSNYDIIGIDEAQFFDKSLLDFCDLHVNALGVNVIVSGLDGDYKRNKFGHILDLIPQCDNITKLGACCVECSKHNFFNEASFTHRTPNNNNNIVLIGGKDIYSPLCRECYNRLNNITIP